MRRVVCNEALASKRLIYLWGTRSSEIDQEIPRAEVNGRLGARKEIKRYSGQSEYSYMRLKDNIDKL